MRLEFSLRLHAGEDPYERKTSGEEEMIRSMKEFRKKYYPNSREKKLLSPKEIGRKLARESLKVLRRELEKV